MHKLRTRGATRSQSSPWKSRILTFSLCLVCSDTSIIPSHSRILTLEYSFYQIILTYLIFFVNVCLEIFSNIVMIFPNICLNENMKICFFYVLHKICKMLSNLDKFCQAKFMIWKIKGLIHDLWLQKIKVIVKNSVSKSKM